MDWDNIKPELQKKLNPDAVKPPPKGKFGNYVDGYHVISEANRIFGEDGWSYEITRLEKVSEQTVELKGNNGQPYEQFRVGYLCTVKVYINGASFKEGSAVGSGVGSPLSVADHHESAVKEAETDALKRALRTYGNTFGLALYDKTHAHVGVDAPDTPPFDSAAARDRIKGMIERAPSLPRLTEIKKDEANTLNILTDPHFDEVKAAFAERKAKLTAGDKAMQAPPDEFRPGAHADEHQYQ